MTKALVNLQTDVEHLEDRVHHLRETVANDASLAVVVPAVTHLDQEATALVTYLRGVTEAFNALSSQNNTTIVDEFFAPRLYVFLAKESLDVIENSLRPLDRLVERVDDRFFFAASASLYVFQGSIQETIDRFYQEQVARHYPDASMQLAFASAACQRLHDPQIANGTHPSMFAPFVERMFADVDASMVKESKSSSASGGGKSSVGSASPAAHSAPPPTPKAKVAVRSPGALDHVELVSAEAPGRGSVGSGASSAMASAPDPSSASDTELAVPKTWDVAGFTKDLQAYRSHVRGVRGAITDADRVAQCSAAKFEAARLQSASEGVTDGDAHTVAIAACGQNIFGQEAAVGQASLKGRTDTPAGDVHPVTGADVSAIARIYYTRLSLTAIQNTQVNVSQHVRLEMPPRSNVANDQKTGLCSVVSVAGSACYAAGESVRVEVRKSFAKGDWHNDDIDGILAQIADQLSGTGSQYVISVTGFASSATAAPRRLGLPAQLLANYKRCIGQAADGNKQLSCARAVWAFDVLIKRDDNLVSRDPEEPDISGAAATRSSSVDAPADRRVEIRITPLAPGQPPR